MDNTDLTGPLTTFQTTEFDEVDFRKMMLTINESGGEHALTKETFEKVFKKWWPELKISIDVILSDKPPDGKVDERTDRDIMEEILLLSRSLSRNAGSKTGLYLPRGLVQDLIKSIEAIIEIQENRHTDALEKTLENLFDVTGYLLGKSESVQDGVREHFDLLHARSRNIMPF